MKAPRDPDRLVRAFLLEGAERLQDRVYDAVRADIDMTRQRAFIGPWRLPTMNKLVPIGLGAAALVAVLVVGPQLLGAPAGTVGPGAPATSTPAPTAAPLAVGEFTSHGVAATIDARGAGADVTGTMTMSDTGQNATVDLECSRATESGLLVIGGLVTDSTFTEYFPEGHRVGIAFKRGSPVQAVWYVVLAGDAPLESCEAMVDALLAEGAGLNDSIEPIEGTVELGS